MFNTPNQAALALAAACAEYMLKEVAVVIAPPTTEQLIRMEALIADMMEHGYIFTTELVDTMALGLDNYNVHGIPGYDGACGLKELLNDILDNEVDDRICGEEN